MAARTRVLPTALFLVAAAASSASGSPADAARIPTVTRSVDAKGSGAASQEVLAAVQQGQSVRVLVYLAPERAAAARAAASVPVTSAVPAGQDGPGLRAAMAAAKRPLLDAVGTRLRNRRDFANLPIFGAEIDSSGALDALLNAPGVGSVVADDWDRATLSSSLPAIGQPDAAAAGHVGTGSVVAVIDSGVDYTRAAFGSCSSPGMAGCRVRELPPDFTTDQFGNPWSDGSPDDPCGSRHGTNVSGVVAGTAPGTQLVVADVFQTIDPNTGATVAPCTPGAESVARISDTLAAVNWVVGRRLAGVNIVAVNFSLGGSVRFTSACSDLHGIASLVAAGIQPVAASGNAAIVNGTYADGVARPACTTGVIPVGATYDSGSVAAFTQSGNFTSMLFAPGIDVSAAGITMSGTSQASPHVAGAIAVIAAQRPDWSLAERTQVLLASARYDAFEYYIGRTRRYLQLGRATRFATQFANGDRAAATPIQTPAAKLFGNTYSSPTSTLWWRVTSPSNSNLYIHGNGSMAAYRAGATQHEPSSNYGCPAIEAESCLRISMVAGQTYDIGIRSTGGDYEVGIVQAYLGLPNDERSSPSPLSWPSSTTVDLSRAGISYLNDLGPVEAGRHSVWFRLDDLSRSVVTIRVSRADVELAAFDGSTMRARTTPGGAVLGPVWAGMLIRLSSDNPVPVTVTAEEGALAQYYREDRPREIGGFSGRTTEPTSLPAWSLPFSPSFGAWWRYTAPADGQLRVSTAGSNVDTTLLVRRAGRPDMTFADTTPENDGAAGAGLEVHAGEVIVFNASSTGQQISLGTVAFSWDLLSRGVPSAPGRVVSRLAPSGAAGTNTDRKLAPQAAVGA